MTIMQAQLLRSVLTTSASYDLGSRIQVDTSHLYVRVCLSVRSQKFRSIIGYINPLGYILISPLYSLRTKASRCR